MKTIILLTVSALAWAQTPAAPAPKIPLEGLDPVALTKGQQLDGDKKFTVTRGGFQYQFANAENKAIFEKDPERYEIQMNGACARMGPGVTGDADDYDIYEGRIYVFASKNCHTRFMKNPDKFVESKQKPLPPFPSSAEAAANGKKLLARAVDALGGAAALDGVAAYQESRARNKEIRTFAFPDRYHAERTFNEKIHVQETIAGGVAFVIGPDGSVREISKDNASALQRDNRRELLVLLRARNDAGFRAVALDDHSIGIEYKGDRVSLIVDPTGRVAGLKYFGRTGMGFGEISRNYSDYRATGKLTLPYQITQSFEGQTDPNPIVVTSIVLNPELPANTFAKPQ